MHAIYAVSWERREGTVEYPLIWTENKTVSAYDVSAYYIEASGRPQPDFALTRIL